MTEILSLPDACRRHDIRLSAAKKAIYRGEISVASRRPRITVYEQEFARDLRHFPRCLDAGCDAPSLRIDGYCDAHAAELESVKVLGWRHLGGTYGEKVLMSAVRKGQVRCADPNRERVLLREADVLEDLKHLPECRETGCREPVLLGGDWCAGHYVLPGLDRAHRINRERSHGHDWLSATEFAELAGVSPTKVCRDANRGALAGEKTSSAWRIPREALDPYRAAQRALPKHPHPSREEAATVRREVLELAGKGLDPKEIAQRVGRARNTVGVILDQAGVPRKRRQPQRKLTSAERAEHVARARELNSAGRSKNEIAAELGVSPGQVAKYLRPKPRPAEQAQCERCGKAIPDPRAHAPRDPDFAPQRYCSVRCTSLATSRVLAQELTVRGLRSADQVAQLLGVSTVRVHELREAGLLAAEPIPFRGQFRPGWGFTDSEIERFQRDWARGEGSDRPQRLLWQDPRRAVEQLRAMGALDAKARNRGQDRLVVELTERDRIERRRKTLGQYRRGRKKANGPADHHVRWLKRLRELEVELLERWQYGPDPEHDPRPTRAEACRILYQEEWAADPEHFPRDGGYPADRRNPELPDPDTVRSGGDVIAKAVKRLEILGTEIN